MAYNRQGSLEAHVCRPERVICLPVCSYNVGDPQGIRGGSWLFSGYQRFLHNAFGLPFRTYTVGDPRGIRALFGGSASSAVCFGVGFGGIRPRALSPFIILKGGIGVALGLAKDIGRNRDEPCSQTLLKFYNALCFLDICRPF